MTSKSAPMTDTETSVAGFDETDLDMIRHGDMLGHRLGQRVYDALLSAAPKPQGDDLEPVADDLLERLRPKHVADEPLARAVVSNDQFERRAAVSAYLVANNALKSEAASALQSLKAERDALAISLEHLADNKRASDEQHAADMAEMDAERAALNKRVADLTALIEAQHGDVVVRTAKLLYEKDDMIAAAEAENATLKREIAELREATLEAAKVIEEGFHKAVGESYRNDGKPSKNDTCPHGRYHYEDCDQCCADAVRTLTQGGK